jgi:hypothetical protein
VRGLPSARSQWQRRIRREAPGILRHRRPVGERSLPANLKVPHLRNIYTKVGRFGFFNLNPFVETASDPSLEGFMGDQIRGFGNNRGGDFDSVFRFMHATTFSQDFLFGPNPGGLPPGVAGDGLRRALESFILAFDSNLKPISDSRSRSADARRRRRWRAPICSWRVPRPAIATSWPRAGRRPASAGISTRAAVGFCQTSVKTDRSVSRRCALGTKA